MLVNGNGEYDQTERVTKTDLSSRTIRIAQIHNISALSFVQVVFSGTPRNKMKQILSEGIEVQGKAYMFVGYTNSGLLDNQVSRRADVIIVSFLIFILYRRLGFLNKQRQCRVHTICGSCWETSRRLPARDLPNLEVA